MKIGVVGSRGFEDYDLLKKTLLRFADAAVIVSGGAKGADTLAERFAEEYSLKTEIFLPDYTKYGRKAPLYRNTQIVESSDIVVAFWDGKSTGTRDSLVKAKMLNKKTVVIHYNETSPLREFE